MSIPPQMTERQRKWFASVQASLQASTGRSLDDWTRIAAACPETAHRKRLAWLKQTYGLGQNYGSLVLSTAFPPGMAWSEPDVLAEALWQDEAARDIFERVQALAEALPEVIVTQRKSFTAFSRKVQFAAVRPHHGGVRLGLALEPAAGPALEPAARESWSERLHAVRRLRAADQVDQNIAALLRAAWDRS